MKEVGLINVDFSHCVTQVTLQTDDMDLAGDVIQSLSSYLGIEVCKLELLSWKHQVVPSFLDHFPAFVTCSMVKLVLCPAGNNLRKIRLVTLGSILGLFYLRRSYLNVPIKL